MTDFAFIFPGQGTQSMGMGASLAGRSAVARATFAEANEALGFPLTKLMWEGPAERLALTENAQPAILTVAVAAWRALTAIVPLKPLAAAGHSLGEYSALVCAGAMTLGDAVRAVRARGKYMQEAVPVGKGAMAAVIGLGADKVAAVVAEASTAAEPVAVAGFNSLEQTTISGTAAGVKRAGEALGVAGARRVLPLRVSAPFHCPLMQPVEAPLREALAPIQIGPLAVPVVSNVEATPNRDPSRVVDLLIDQLTRPVRWVDSVHAMRDLGAVRFVELGAGRTLAGMIRKIDSSLKALSVEDGASLDRVAEQLG